jgi:cytoskeletal protein CcmA (bactofilin family)
MTRLIPFAALVVATCFPLSGLAQTQIVTNGDDSFVAGDSLAEALDAPGDVFVGGRVSTIGGQAAGDVHVAGFDVIVSTDVGGDLYAAGGTVTIRADVGEDLSAMAYSLRIDPASQTAGNARLMGGTVTIEGPITGNLTALGQDVNLNAPVDGDVRITAKTVRFGEAAVINGTLTYSAETEMTVPASVIAPERVRFEALPSGPDWSEMEGIWRDGRPVFWPALLTVITSAIIGLLFFVVLGALLLSVFPNRVETMRQDIAHRPGQVLGLGVLGLSMLFGMVPIIAMTVVGIPFIPFVILGIIVVWTLGYLMGGYAVAMRLWVAFGQNPDPALAIRLLVLIAAIIAIALLNYIPFVGWALNFTLVLLGVGAITLAVFNGLVGNAAVATLDVDMNPKPD